MSLIQHFRRSPALGFAALPLVAAPGSAQLCFGGKPQSMCSTFIVLDAGVAGELNGPREDSHTLLTGELGLMRNRGHLACGATFNVESRFGESGASPQYGARIHVRSWSDSDSVAVDVSAGPVLLSRTYDSVAYYPNGGAYFRYVDSGTRLGLSARVGITIHDQFGMFVEGEVRPRVIGTPVGLYVGANLGSKPALIAGVALALLASAIHTWIIIRLAILSSTRRYGPALRCFGTPCVSR